MKSHDLISISVHSESTCNVESCWYNTDHRYTSNTTMRATAGSDHLKVHLAAFKYSTRYVKL